MKFHKIALTRCRQERVGWLPDQKEIKLCFLNFPENMLSQYVEMNLNFKFFTLLDSIIETF